MVVEYVKMWITADILPAISGSGQKLLPTLVCPFQASPCRISLLLWAFACRRWLLGLPNECYTACTGIWEDGYRIWGMRRVTLLPMARVPADSLSLGVSWLGTCNSRFQTVLPQCGDILSTKGLGFFVCCYSISSVVVFVSREILYHFFLWSSALLAVLCWWLCFFLWLNWTKSYSCGVFRHMDIWRNTRTSIKSKSVR